MLIYTATFHPRGKEWLPLLSRVHKVGRIFFPATALTLHLKFNSALQLSFILTLVYTSGLKWSNPSFQARSVSE